MQVWVFVMYLKDISNLKWAYFLVITGASYIHSLKNILIFKKHSHSLQHLEAVRKLGFCPSRWRGFSPNPNFLTKFALEMSANVTKYTQYKRGPSSYNNLTLNLTLMFSSRLLLMLSLMLLVMFAEFLGDFSTLCLRQAYLSDVQGWLDNR